MSLSSRDSLRPNHLQSRRVNTNDPPALPHPAEDLSADDDLLSWILVDQLGAMPNTKLGVHPQQVKFIGPVFKTDEVLRIVQEVCTAVVINIWAYWLQTVIKGKILDGMSKLQE
jgi:hypothetical protein